MKVLLLGVMLVIHNGPAGDIEQVKPFYPSVEACQEAIRIAKDNSTVGWGDSTLKYTCIPLFSTNIFGLPKSD